MRSLGLLLACSFFACAHDGTKIHREEGASLARFNRIGVPAFTDARGLGSEIAKAVEKGLLDALHPPVDGKSLEELLKKYKPDRENGLGTEAMTSIRNQTGADAVLFGRMAPDWSAAIVILVDTNMGGSEMTGVVKPAGSKKAFTTPDEVAKEVLEAMTPIH